MPYCGFRFMPAGFSDLKRATFPIGSRPLFRNEAGRHSDQFPARFLRRSAFSFGSVPQASSPSLINGGNRMPAKRELTMRQIRQMLRLARDGVSAREIGRTLGVARSTIQDNLKRASAAGLAWPLAGDLTDAVLATRLFAHAGVKRGFRRRAEPDWGSLACELKRPGVNLMVLWEEYRAVYPAGC